MNYTYSKEITYWKRTSFESFSTENKVKELIRLALNTVILVRKANN